MDIIKERNNPDPYEYLFIVLAFGGNVIIYLWSYPFLFYFSCFITLFICFFLHFRNVEFTFDKNRVKLKLLFFFIPYKIIDINFDSVKISNLDAVTFYKNQNDVLSIHYVDDIDEPTYTLGALEIRQGQKKFDLGNKKTSFNLFEKIKIATSKYNTADT